MLRPALATLALSLLVAASCDKRGAPPPESWQPRRACTTSDECRPAPACCPSPCTSNVIHRDDVEPMERRVRATCTDAERAKCPQAGACVAHAYSCVRGQCALLLEGSPDWPTDARAPEPPAPDASPTSPAGADASPSSPTSNRADDSCQRDDDCVPVRGSGGGCCPSPCPGQVVNRRDQARAQEAANAACAAVPKRSCPSAGGCRGNAILCVRSKCAVVYEGDPDYRPRKAP